MYVYIYNIYVCVLQKLHSEDFMYGPYDKLIVLYPTPKGEMVSKSIYKHDSNRYNTIYVFINRPAMQCYLFLYSKT